MIARQREDKQQHKQKRKREKGNWDWFLNKFDDGNYQDRLIVNQRKQHLRREPPRRRAGGSPYQSRLAKGTS